MLELLPLKIPIVNEDFVAYRLLAYLLIAICFIYSAGVGRAGCFICIDAMIDRIKHENSIDVYGQVTCMRAERNYMVRVTLLHLSINHLYKNRFKLTYC